MLMFSWTYEIILLSSSPKTNFLRVEMSGECGIVCYLSFGSFWSRGSMSDFMFLFLLPRLLASRFVPVETFRGLFTSRTGQARLTLWRNRSWRETNTLNVPSRSRSSSWSTVVKFYARGPTKRFNTGCSRVRYSCIARRAVSRTSNTCTNASIS